MLTEFARDHAFTIAWFGLMTMVWFGWGQEDPPQRWRWRLGAGSVLGLSLLGVFGYGVVLRWGDGTALEGRYSWFGVLTLRSEEHTSELQSRGHLVCRLLLEKKKYRIAF